MIASEVIQILKLIQDRMDPLEEKIANLSFKTDANIGEGKKLDDLEEIEHSDLLSRLSVLYEVRNDILNKYGG